MDDLNDLTGGMATRFDSAPARTIWVTPGYIDEGRPALSIRSGARVDGPFGLAVWARSRDCTLALAVAERPQVSVLTLAVDAVDAAIPGAEREHNPERAGVVIDVATVDGTRAEGPFDLRGEGAGQ